MYQRRYAKKKAPAKKAQSYSSSRGRRPLYPSKILNKGKFQANPDIICFMPKDSQNAFPPRWRTKFTAQFYGSTTSGAGSGDYTWNFNLNSPIHPLDYANTGLTINNLTAATYMPAGLSQLFNANIYNTGRVYASAIEVDVLPQSVSDSVVATLTPIATAGSLTTVAQALTQPYTKQATFASGRQTTPKGNALKHYFTASKLMGVSRQAVQDDISGTLIFQYPTVNPNLLMVWALNIETGDNSILGQPLEVRVKIVYYTELFANLSASQPIA